MVCWMERDGTTWFSGKLSWLRTKQKNTQASTRQEWRAGLNTQTQNIIWLLLSNMPLNGTNRMYFRVSSNFGTKVRKPEFFGLNV